MFDNDEFIERRKNQMDDITKRLDAAKMPLEKQLEVLAANNGFSKLAIVGVKLDGGVMQMSLNLNLIELLGFLELGKQIALKQNEARNA